MKTMVFAQVPVVIAMLLGCGAKIGQQSDPDTVTLKPSVVSPAVAQAADSAAGLGLYRRTAPGFENSTPPFSTAQIREYIYTAASMAELSDAELGQVVAETYSRVESNENVDGRLADGNFFVLWRLVFKVPADTQHDAMRFHAFHSGWVQKLSWVDSSGTKWFPSEFPLKLDSMGRVSRIYPVAGFENWYYTAIDLAEMIANHPRRAQSEILAMLP